MSEHTKPCSCLLIKKNKYFTWIYQCVLDERTFLPQAQTPTPCTSWNYPTNKREHIWKYGYSVVVAKTPCNWYLNKQARDVCMVRTTSDKQYLKDFSFLRTSYSFLWPPLITLLARTRHGVIYDSTSLATIDHIISYYFLQQGYDLQMRLMYRNGIWNKETEITYCSCTKMFLHSSWVLQVLTPTMSQIFLGKII